MINGTVTEKGMEMDSTLSQPEAGSHAVSRQKRRDGEHDPEGLVIKNPNPASIQMLIAFNALNYQVFTGVTRKALVEKRRRRNRAARISRRINRGKA